MLAFLTAGARTPLGAARAPAWAPNGGRAAPSLSPPLTARGVAHHACGCQSHNQQPTQTHDRQHERRLALRRRRLLLLLGQGPRQPGRRRRGRPRRGHGQVRALGGRRRRAAEDHPGPPGPERQPGARQPRPGRLPQLDGRHALLHRPPHAPQRRRGAPHHLAQDPQGRHRGGARGQARSGRGRVRPRGAAGPARARPGLPGARAAHGRRAGRRRDAAGAARQGPRRPPPRQEGQELAPGGHHRGQGGLRQDPHRRGPPGQPHRRPGPAEPRRQGLRGADGRPEGALQAVRLGAVRDQRPAALRGQAHQQGRGPGPRRRRGRRDGDGRRGAGHAAAGAARARGRRGRGARGPPRGQEEEEDQGRAGAGGRRRVERRGVDARSRGGWSVSSECARRVLAVRVQ